MGRSGKLPRSLLRTVRKWLLREPNEYGFESGSWQLNMILEMIKREFGIGCKIRTLRRKLHRIRFSWRESAVASRTNRPPRRCRRSSSRWPAGRRRSTARRRRPAFVEDEAEVQISQNPGYGWRPINGRDAVPIGFFDKVRQA